MPALFRYLFILLLFTAFSADSSAQVLGIANSVQNNAAGDEVLSLVYDDATGNLAVHTGGLTVTTLEIKSELGIFQGERPADLDGLFDVFTPNKFFVLKGPGFGSSDFGPILPTGWTAAELATDLSLDGSIVPEGGIPSANVVLGIVDFDLASRELPTLDFVGPRPDADPRFAGNVSLVSTLNADEPTFIYDSAIGNFGFMAGGSSPRALHLVSNAWMFGGKWPDILATGADFFSKNDILKLSSGIEQLNFGQVLQPGLDPTFLANDLRADTADNNQFSLFVGPVDFENIEVPRGEVFIDPADVVPPIPSEGLVVTNVVKPQLDAERVLVHYDPDTGRVQVAMAGPNPEAALRIFTTLELTSANGNFTGPPAATLSGSIDQQSPNRLLKFESGGLFQVDFGNVAATGLSNNQFVNDVCVSGTWLDGGEMMAEYQYPGADIVPFTCNAESGNSDEPAAIDLQYDDTSGDLTVEIVDESVARAKGDELTTIEIRSQSGIFTGPRPDSLSDTDTYDASLILKQDRDGFQQVVFSSVIDSGLSDDFIASDLSIDITTKDGNRLGIARLNENIIVPEPSSALMIALSIFVLVPFRRR